jgi:hypothetical protein
MYIVHVNFNNGNPGIPTVLGLKVLVNRIFVNTVYVQNTFLFYSADFGTLKLLQTASVWACAQGFLIHR